MSQNNYETIEWNVPNTNSKNELRKFVVLKFMEENPGKGSGKLATRYKYIVEKFSDGRLLYLIRPAQKKFGFDFQIWIENWNKTKRNRMPSHKDIIQDLKFKKDENQKKFIFLLKAINKLFICEDDNRIINWLKINKISFSRGEDVEVLLKIIKWMFIEQDIRYWNFSGRQMIKKHIDNNFSSILKDD